MKKVTGFPSRGYTLDITRLAAVGQACGVRLTDTVRVSGLDVDLSAAGPVAEADRGPRPDQDDLGSGGVVGIGWGLSG